jgi:hypothetical protein
MLDEMRANTAETAGKGNCRVMSEACPRTVRLAIRRLEELDLAQAVVARALLSELGGGGAPDADRPLERTVAVTPKQLLAYSAVSEACRYVEDADDFLRLQVTALRDVTFFSSVSPNDLSEGVDAALFNIVEVREWCDVEEELAAVHWMVRGGLWAGSQLRWSCRDALCRIARASLQPKRESAASLVLRIGSMVMTGSCPRGERSQITVSVESLLAAVGRLPARSLRLGSWGRRTADDLQDAARALHATKFFERADMPGWPPNTDGESDAIECWLRAETVFALAPNVP